jgi:hypothetical protein
MIAIAVCILIAAMYQSLSNIVSAKEETNIIWKVAAIAYRFGEEVWYQTKRIIGGVISIQISFLVQHLVPWTVGVGFAVTLAYVSTVLFVYLQNSGSGLAVAWALLLGMVSLYLSIYVCHVGRLWRPGYGRPPYIRQLKTISRVSVVDSLMLLLHASYPIPIAVLLMIVLQRAFRLDLLPTRIGPFTITLLAILIVFIALGGGRRALNSKSAGVGRK